MKSIDIFMRTIVIDISVLYNIHKTYGLKKSNLRDLSKKKPKTMEKIEKQ